MVKKVESIWMDGKLVPWDQAQVHVLTHALHYGLGVFEGIRCYQRADGQLAIFRLKEHVRRLFESAKIATLPMTYTEEQVCKACIEVVSANKLGSCYLRPLAFVGDGAMGLGAKDNPTRLVIAAWEWGAYLGEEALKAGIRAKISTYQRFHVNALMAKGKIVGHYVNSIIAKREAMQDGYDEAIMLDAQGYVSEATGENIFVVRDNTVFTPPHGTSILGGITRDTIIKLCQELKIPVVERLISRDELYVADEVFLCGTAAEVTPVRDIDHRTIGQGARGDITERLQKRFFEIATGSDKEHDAWLSYVK